MGDFTEEDMVDRTIRLLVPTAESATAQVRLRPRPARLACVAFLHNGQPRYDAIAPDLLAALSARPGVSVRQYRKASYGQAAGTAMLEEIAAGSEAAIVGLAC